MADTSIKSGRFEPKGAVDVIHYLLQKVRGEQVPYYTNVATECDLHSEDETWKKEFVNITDEDEDTLFFFTKSKKKKTEEKSPPIDTTNGGGYGTWMENCIIPMWIINKNNELIGSVQPFDYVKERSPTTTNCERRSCERWVMSEYCLGDIYEESTYNYVMCKVIKINVPQVTWGSILNRPNLDTFAPKPKTRVFKSLRIFGLVICK